MGRRRATLWAAAVAVGVAAVLIAIFVWPGGGRSGHAPDPIAGAGSSPVAGFDEVAFRVTDGPGAGGPAHCALLADTSAERGRGLMFRHDLGGYAAMVFVWPASTTDEFYMKDTLIPLSVAWFDRTGRFVSEADMAPCPSGDSCPLYAATGPYTVAIEVSQGGLPRLGIGPGSSITVGGQCG